MTDKEQTELARQLEIVVESTRREAESGEAYYMSKDEAINRLSQLITADHNATLDRLIEKLRKFAAEHDQPMKDEAIAAIESERSPMSMTDAREELSRIIEPAMFNYPDKRDELECRCICHEKGNMVHDFACCDQAKGWVDFAWHTQAVAEAEVKARLGMVEYYDQVRSNKDMDWKSLFAENRYHLKSELEALSPDKEGYWTEPPINHAYDNTEDPPYMQGGD